MKLEVSPKATSKAKGKKETKNVGGNGGRRVEVSDGLLGKESQHDGEMEEKATSLSSTAELSDLVGYQQALSGARRKITEPLH